MVFNLFKLRIVVLWGSRVLNSESENSWWMQVPQVMSCVIAVICLATALVSVNFLWVSQTESVCRTWIDHAVRHSLGMHGLPAAKPGPWPGIVFCRLQVCCNGMSLRPQHCMQQVESGPAHSDCGVQAKRSWCRRRRGRGGLASSQRYNITCHIIYVKLPRMLSYYMACELRMLNSTLLYNS